MSDNITKDFWTFNGIILFLIITTVVVMGVGMWRQNKVVILKEEWVTKEIKILDIKPPKHFKIIYLDVATGQVNHYSSKHCGLYNDNLYIVKGNTYKVQLKWIKQKDYDGVVRTYIETNGCDMLSSIVPAA